MSQTEQRDPRQGAKPPFPEQEQPYPGSDAELRPTADHGEESYRGSGKLEGLPRSSPVATAASAAPSRSRSRARAPMC